LRIPCDLRVGGGAIRSLRRVRRGRRRGAGCGDDREDCMSKPKLDVEEWAQAASELSSNEPPTTNMPMHVLFGEAVDVARFFERYWTTKVDEQGNVVLLGLESAVPKGQAAKPGAVALSAETGGEILSLQRACQEAQTSYLMAVGPRSGAGTIERGHALLGEITAALEWYFDDGVQDEKDAMLARVSAAHDDDPGTIDALASALEATRPTLAVAARRSGSRARGIGGAVAGIPRCSRPWRYRRAVRSSPPGPSRRPHAEPPAPELRACCVALWRSRAKVPPRAWLTLGLKEASSPSPSRQPPDLPGEIRRDSQGGGEAGR